MQEAIQKQSEEKEAAEQQTQKLVDQLKSTKTATAAASESNKSANGGLMEKLLLGVILLLWIAIMVYTNYFMDDRTENLDEASSFDQTAGGEI